ncbi:hypothetical protein GORBP_025_00040 [Gordonia rubripertincta NBRC 101908]|uniref:Transposase n=1 Tax=Gordonia rubripertincta NBRC 101908 TaxID=1077975 RepID=A0ABQ0HNX2_GORRU|nr:hypothetical protein GORBP_025_00040 [Gordonia rubripertincta NBRC 101908]
MCRVPPSDGLTDDDITDTIPMSGNGPTVRSRIRGQLPGQRFPDAGRRSAAAVFECVDVDGDAQHICAQYRIYDSHRKFDGP